MWNYKQEKTHKRKGHSSRKLHENRLGRNVKKTTPSSSTERELFVSTPVKNQKTVATQCEIEITQSMSKNATDVQISEKTNIFHELLPQISSVIEKTEKNLQKTFQQALKPPKVVQERAVSPIKNVVETKHEEIKHPTPEPPPNSPTKKSQEPGNVEDLTREQKNPPIGDLLINIQNIKDSRCLLDGFKHELSQLRKDIQKCRNCKEEKGKDVMDNYCDKHVVYIPLLRVGEVGSKSDQINLFSLLRTEAYIKKELENQIQHISKLERKLSRAKKGHESLKTETIEKELSIAKSYFNNLLVKQQNERLLNEQQKIMRGKAEHVCDTIENCNRCCLKDQVHDLLKKVRENIAKDIEDSKQRLKVQKMPNIDIRKPLQMQNILKLDIPPSKPPEEPTRNNLVYEAVVKDAKHEDQHQTQEVQTKTLVDQGTNVEIKKEEPQQKTSSPSEMQHYYEIQPENLSGFFDSEFAEYPPTRRKRLEKTPSQLGFRRNVGTQCDSKTSLLEIMSADFSPNARMSAHTQTVASRDNSYFLFGFKEYLMKRDGGHVSRLPNAADANLQVSLEESNHSVIQYRTVGVNTETSQTRLSKSKSCEFQGVTAVVQCESEDDAEAEPENASEDVKEAETEDVGEETNLRSSQHSLKKSSRSIPRTPSLKKMFLPPSNTDVNQQTDMENTMQNPYIEPKYKMKRFSFNKQESEPDVKHVGDIFYKSLTEKEELPERKIPTYPEAQPTETPPEDGIETVPTSYLHKLQLVDDNLPEKRDPDQDTEEFIEDQDAKKSSSYISVIKDGPSAEASVPDHPEVSKRKITVENLYEYMEDVEISGTSCEESERSQSEQNGGGPAKEALPEGKAYNEEGNVEEENSDPEYMDHEEEEDVDHEENSEEATNIKEPVGKQFTFDPSLKEDEDEEKTVLSLFTPTYKFLLNRSKDKKKSSDRNILLRIPLSDTTKSLKKIGPEEKYLTIRDKPESFQKIAELFNNDKFLISSSSTHTRRDVTNLTNYILHKPTPDDTNLCKFRTGFPKVAQERLDYLKKCSKLDKSLDSSSMASSEGEVKCRCKNISDGEIHNCPLGRFNLEENRPGIHYKENLSSHLVLEKERKHYQHWVTYYATKKIKNESSSSSVESDTVNNN